MKITRFIAALGLAILVLAACTNEDELQNNALPDGAVHITADIEGAATRANINAATGAGTFETGDVWGLYTTVDGSTINANTEYTYDTDVLYWENLSKTAPVTFSAHYPRITGTVTDPKAYIFAVTVDNSAANDLLVATDTKSKGASVTLTFKHLMHRLVVNLKAGEGVSSADLASAVIETQDGTGAQTVAEVVVVNLISATADATQTAGSLCYSATGATADWILVPQDLKNDKDWLTITIGNDKWSYKVPASLNPSDASHPTRLESGKKLTLDLTLKKNSSTGQTSVELTGSDISGWGDGETFSDEVSI